VSPETLRIDRVFPGVGRIAKASGTTIPAVLRKINRALDRCYDNGRLDVLRAIRDGHVHPLAFLDAVTRSALHELPVGDTMPKLDEAWLAWVDSVASEYSDDHVSAFETTRRYLEKAAPEAKIAELPVALEGLRKSLGARHPRSFNLARAHVLAFVRATLKKSHAIYIACSAVEPKPEPKAAPRTLVTPQLMRTWFPHPETDKVDAIAWSMVANGMGQKELWGVWETRSDRVHIGGTKRDGRDRDIPLVRAPAVPQLSRDRFEKLFRARALPITPYDMRRTYAKWLESAGVPRTRRKLYMGHGAQDVTDLYERHEVDTFLAEDAKKVAEFLARPTVRHTAKRKRA
jgi:hypothetical protein